MLDSLGLSVKKSPITATKIVQKQNKSIKKNI